MARHRGAIGHPIRGAYAANVRAALIVNPAATTTSPRMREVLIHALAASCDLTVHLTGERGHARRLAATAAQEGAELLLTFGGDGTAHEAVNGLLDAAVARPPVFAPLPGGSANVFSRALGFSVDPVEATGQVIEAIETDRTRRIGLGRVGIDDRPPQWFTFTAGAGLDAEVIHAMESVRRTGGGASPARYVQVSLAALARTDRRTPRLRVQLADGRTLTGVYTAIIQNCVPWTYLGRIPISPCPDARFDRGLDVCAVRSLGIAVTLGLAGTLLRGGRLGRADRHVIAHDQLRITVASETPVPVQVDGEGYPAGRTITLTSAPDALGVLDTR